MGNSILFLEGSDHSLGWGRSFSMAKAFVAAGCSVLYSEYPRPVLYKDRGFFKDSDELNILKPVGLPAMRYPFLSVVHRRMLLKQIADAVDKIQFTVDVLWICTVANVGLIKDLIKKYRPRLVVYDCADDRAAHSAPFISEQYVKRVIAAEKKIFKEADIAFAVSEKLTGRLSTYVKTYFMPNGVDLSLFHSNNTIKKPTDIASINGKKIGFVGNLGYWIDTDLIKWLSEKKPDWSFVFIGSSDVDVDALSFADNVRFLGVKPYSEVPSYMAALDVCIVPFKDCPIAQGSDSLKVLQYLAMGKPVVATSYKGVRDYEGIVSVAKTKLDFLKAIEGYIDCNSSDLINKRIDVAREHSWGKRIDQVLAILEQTDLSVNVGNSI